MKISPIVNNNISQKSVNKFVGNKVSIPLRTVAPAIMSTAAASAIAANAMARPHNMQDVKQQMLTHSVNGKRVFDQNAIMAINGIKKFAPEWVGKIMQDPTNVKSCTYIPKSEKTNFSDIYIVQTLDNSKTLKLKIANLGYGNGDQVLEKFEQFVNPDGSVKKVNKTLIGGTDKYQTSTFNIGKDSAVQIVENDVISNNSGMLSKHKSEKFYEPYDSELRLSKVTETSLNGTKEVGIYTYGESGLEKNQVTQISWTEYSPQGVINSKTTYKNIYQKALNPQTGEIFPVIKGKHVECVDYKNNTTTVAELQTFDNVVDDLVSQTRKITNPKTGKVTVEILTKSDVDGVYNSKIIDENGNEKIESLGVKNPDGSVHVEKHFVNLDGCKTEYKFNSSPNNDEMDLLYQIIESDGRVLSTVDRKFKRLSPDKTYSSLNGHEHIMTKDDNGITVKDLQSGEESYVEYKDLFKSEADNNSKNREFIESLPADMILNFKNKNIKIQITDKQFESYLLGNDMVTSPNVNCIAHESGHSKDMLTPDGQYRGFVFTDIPNFKFAYENEKTDFLNTMSNPQKKYIEYFINDVHIGNNDIRGTLGEVIAETNAIFALGFPAKSVQARQHYLQKYFPHAISELTTYMMPHSNIAR
ncbi:hypothetical protein IJ732_02545 [bacterium]|nr:hypothetical protein [bacterium]